MLDVQLVLPDKGHAIKGLNVSICWDDISFGPLKRSCPTFVINHPLRYESYFQFNT